ncbi:MAG: hypothetical protein QM785_15440 [Pyrinomonadaceae bacterium]
MIKRNEKQPITVTRPTVTKRFTTYSLILISTLMLATGFFFAATQHFSSMDYGMKNSRLRKQVDQLEAEKRRLMLAKEVSMSPVEIKKAAKKAGLLDPAPLTAQPEQPTLAKAVPSPAKTDQPLVIKTAAVSSAAKTVTPAIAKADKNGREVKKTISAE